jgi:hypothetical protein
MYSVFDSRVGRIAEYGQATRRLIREYVLGWGEARPDRLAVEARQRAMRPRTLSRAGFAGVKRGVTSLIRDPPHRAAGVCDEYHRGKGLDRQLFALRRCAHGDGHASQYPLPRPVVPGRERPAPELDAGL